LTYFDGAAALWAASRLQRFAVLAFDHVRHVAEHAHAFRFGDRLHGRAAILFGRSRSLFDQVAQHIIDGEGCHHRELTLVWGRGGGPWWTVRSSDSHRTAMKMTTTATSIA